MGCTCTKPPDNIDQENDRFCLSDGDESNILDSDQIFKLQKSPLQKSNKNDHDKSYQQNNTEILHHVMDTLGKQYSVISNNAYEIAMDNAGEEQENNHSDIRLQNDHDQQHVHEDKSNADQIQQHVVDTELNGEHEL